MHLSSLGLSETSHNQGKGLPTLRSLIRPLFLCTSIKLYIIDIHIMLVVLVYNKPENNDSNWVKKTNKHRDFGDYCCRPVGKPENQCVDHLLELKVSTILLSTKCF